jgi:putative ABC transport system permease protein
MIPVRYNLRSIIVRRVGTLMTVLGVGLTVAVFVSILAMVHGLQNTFVDSGEPLNLMIIRQGSQSETNSFFNRDIKGIIETMDGVQSVAGEIVVVINRTRVTGDTSNVMVRGVDPKTSLELRPTVKIAEGRMFKPGLRELVVSRAVSRRFKSANIGDMLKIGRSTWNVVGILDASKSAQDSEIWGDYNEIAQEFERPVYSSLLVRVRDAGSVSSVKDRIASDRRVKLDAFSEKEYYASQTSSALPIQVLGYLVAVIMAIGSCFAVMNTMYAATAYRTREIATLRVLGYSRFSILVSFVLESVLLAVCGGIVGCLMALPVNGITTGTTNFSSFSEVVFQFLITPGLMLQGVIFAAVMGGIGGFLPGVRAAFTPIVRALRTEV